MRKSTKGQLVVAGRGGRAGGRFGRAGGLDVSNPPIDSRSYKPEGSIYSGGYIYIKSGWSRGNSGLERVSEPETLPQFTAPELADRYAAGEVNYGEIHHWLADTVAAEECRKTAPTPK